MKTVFHLTRGAFLVLFFFQSFAQADESTCPKPVETKLDSSIATASSISNFRGAENSIRKKSGVMINDALSKVSTWDLEPCPTACPHSGREVLFSSVPNVVLNNYDGAKECNALLAATSKDPITFEERTYKSAEELASWLSELGQGKGKDGERLYLLCPGDCSPKYYCHITADGDKLKVRTEVICGEARDKWENNYLLTSTMRASCTTAPKALP